MATPYFHFRMHWRRWWLAEGRHSLQSPLLLQLYDAIAQADPIPPLEQVVRKLLPSYPLHSINEQESIPPQIIQTEPAGIWLVKGLYSRPKRFQQWQNCVQAPLLAIEIQGEGLLFTGSAFSPGHYIFDL
ncbi:hypothetical protein A3SI_18492 [Nitritalea halalkaliphila LW7]|uniref:Uncharacterized protein n=1 Tax=Nitritalea halalkaliphila LW7 TaxID=1189621 RepID=I5BU40_9BACT|nr:hypothetical protein [Nitritalea halalkaliphila]EIM73092.1 hypothetical protein A3SI_18492 [Nitritalea halalkaliphila LW7]